MIKLLSIKNLKVSVEDKVILQNLNLEIDKNQIHALMGPNGSGKSTLAYTLMGHPKYKIESGSIFFDGQDIAQLSPDKRAKLGIFLAFQTPLAIEGLTLKDFLRHAYNSLYIGTEKELDFESFSKMLELNCEFLKIDKSFLNRFLNYGFSGGEKKKIEVLQIAVLKPKFIILDEIDSGLDVDALKTVCQAILKVKELNPEISILVITHFPRILDYIVPDFVHVLVKGEIIKTGDKSLAKEIEKIGYKNS